MEIANKRAENQLMSEVAANLQHLQEIVKYDTNSVTWTVLRFPGAFHCLGGCSVHKSISSQGHGFYARP